MSHKLSGQSLDGIPPVTAIIQARLGSSRLPQKMLEKIASYTLLEWVCLRSKRATMVDHLVLATSDLKRDNALADAAEGLGLKVVRGDEEDVLARFALASACYPSHHIVRICADNPFICPIEIDRLIEFHLVGAFDYSFNHVPRAGNRYPDGFGAEIVRADLLQKINKEILTSAKSQREHVTQSIWEQQNHYKIGVLQAPNELYCPGLKLDVDTLSDLQKLRSYASRVNLYDSAFTIVAALKNMDAEAL